MEKILLFRILLIPWLLSFFFPIFAQAISQTAPKDYVPDEIIVKFIKEAAIEATKIQGIAMTGLGSVDALNEKFKTTTVEKVFPQKSTYPLANIYRLRFTTEISIPQLLESYRKDPNILWAEPNYIYRAAIEPNDPYYSSQWHLPKIQAPSAWDIEKGSASVVIGVIDTGVDTDHPDLANQIWTNADEIADNSIDDDGNGYVDDVQGWDFVLNNTDPNPKPNGLDDNNEYGPDDGVDHGTHVAGIAAAIGNNSLGITGISWNCTILPVRVLDDEGEGNYLNVIRGIVYAVDNGADIINLSLGGPYSIEFNDAIAYAYSHGVIIVAAAGNEDKDIDQNMTSPACNDNNGNHVICVAATDNNDVKTAFSNYGKIFVDVSAPGLGILSTLYYDPSFGFNNYYGFYSGTSMSTPMVSGLAALIKSYKPEMSNTEIDQLILDTSNNIDDQNSGYTGLLGSGRINVFSAISAIADSSVAIVKIVPAHSEVRLHSKVTSDVLVESVSNLGAFEFDLSYDGKIVQVDSSSDVTLGSFLGSTNRSVAPIGPVIDNDVGLLKFGGFSFGSNQGPTGGGILASIIWTPKDTGSTILDFQKIQLTDQDGKIIPVSTKNHTIKIIQGFWADINRDEKVDIVDIQMVAARWNSKIGEPNYNPICDVDNEGEGDGDIDIIDIQLVAWWWHKLITVTNNLFITKSSDKSSSNASLRIVSSELKENFGVLDVIIEDATDVGAFQFDLVFDKNLTKIDKVELGEFLGQTSNQVTTLGPQGNCTKGDLSFGAFSYGGNSGASSSGVLARIIYNSRVTQGSPIAIENVQITDIKGNVLPFNIEVNIIKEDTKSLHLPTSYSLKQNYPNPFNPETIIEYELPKTCEVTIKIYNISGQLVNTLVNQKQRAGYYSALWNAKDDKTRQVVTGLYFYTLQANDFVQMKKMLLIQ